MSLRHALLGLLAEGPASGYDLAQQFQAALGTVWPAQHPKIYSELTKLDGEGLIEVESRGPRGRKAYAITDSGLAEVRRWLTDSDVDHTLRVEALMRSYFFWLMTPAQLQAHLDEEAEFYSTMAAQFREFAASKDRGEWGTSAPTQSIRMTIEAGVRMYQALADWAEWSKKQPLATRKRRDPR
ncbi:MAG TPA: PadR family transcriptional regulator [Mycobacteriales bacterium]|nr:PadR family transcriptional regulator [Mycobacteriales bacterium]